MNALDQGAFIGLLSNGYVAQADINRDGVVNFLDISPFIRSLNLPGVPVHNVDSILQVSGDTDIGGRAFTSYASQKMTYYVGDELTDGIATSWKGANENLETSYGGSNLNEFNANSHNGRVKSQTVGLGGCGSCGGEAGITKYFYYMNLNETKLPGHMIVIEDLIDRSGSPISRCVRTLNQTV